jgi:hypothetical protein
VSSKRFTKKIFDWLYQIKADRELPPSAALFALQLITHFNEKRGGVCWASCQTIGDSIGMHESTAVRLYHLFERRGHLKVEWGKQGKGHSNRCWMIIQKPAPAQVSGDTKTCTSAAKTCTSAGEPCYNHRMGSPKGKKRKALCRQSPRCWRHCTSRASCS